MQSLSTLFVSHGSPTTIIERHSPARAFLAGLGDQFERPSAILSVTAHWVTGVAKVGATETPETIHDFYGFPEELFQMTYPAPGDAALAERVHGLLRSARIDTITDPERGLDHGTWAPLKLMYPEAEIPVAQLSVQRANAAHHVALGQALAPLRDEGVLILGSGSTTHNLSEFSLTNRDVSPKAKDFDDWLGDRIWAGDREALINYRAEAPHAEWAHPTDEHLMPLYVAMGAAGEKAVGRVLHQGIEHGNIGMSAFAFNSP